MCVLGLAIDRRRDLATAEGEVSGRCDYCGTLQRSTPNDD